MLVIMDDGQTFKERMRDIYALWRSGFCRRTQIETR